ncbi:MAG: hypothetical protein ACYTFY_22955 [Planctomycetota bacterium]|jgi:hypothetical protein
MLQITNLVDGTVINRNRGEETESSLMITVEGTSAITDTVTVNGVAAEQNSFNFKADISLTEKHNTITAETCNMSGKFQHTVRVVWDRKSFKRYNFFIDDNIFFLTDIAGGSFTSIFDHFYLKELKRLNNTYGTKFTLNLFYNNDHNSFEMKDFPDKFKSEFQDNSEWLQLSFHAYSEFPDRPYQNASADKLAADYDLLKNEIIRFAGEESFQPPVVIHWAMTHPSNFKVLKERGVNTLCGRFIGARTSITEANHNRRVTDIGYYTPEDKAVYLDDNSLLYDYESDILLSKIDLVCNLESREEIAAILNNKINNLSYNETICLATHEQYSFDYYENYIPDHFERMEEAIRTVSEAGYKAVFFSDGLAGNSY